MPQVALSEMVQALATQPTLVSFPTDTVPALAAVPAQAALIFAAKQRPLVKPLILMGASLSDLLPYVSTADLSAPDAKAGAATNTAIDEWQAITLRHWPGQLTLVLPVNPCPPQNLSALLASADADTLGIRVPDHPVALALLSQTGPLATTSANLSGQPALSNVAAIAQTFPDALTLASGLYKQSTASGTPSTIAKWTLEGWQILRQGEIQL